MKRPKLIQTLIDQGLLDEHCRLTAKGHEYTEQVKLEYRAKTLDAEKRIRTKQEKIQWPTKWR